MHSFNEQKRTDEKLAKLLKFHTIFKALWKFSVDKNAIHREGDNKTSFGSEIPDSIITVLCCLSYTEHFEHYTQ